MHVCTYTHTHTHTHHVKQGRFIYTRLYWPLYIEILVFTSAYHASTEEPLEKQDDRVCKLYNMKNIKGTKDL